MAARKLKAPFPYFGGKSTVARAVWLRLGDISNYIEPFCGSAAMLLSRPHAPRIETINDYDGHVANVWRALKFDPEGVAEWCDNPVNEADLHARHRWLVYGPESADFRQRVRTDPDYFDSKFAGYWLYGICCWIGSGWCQNPDWEGRGSGVIGSTFALGKGVTTTTLEGQCPQLRGDSGAAGSGIHASGAAKRVKLTGGSTSDNRTHNGAGVHGQEDWRFRKRPRIHGGAGADPPGVHSGMVGQEKELQKKRPRAHTEKSTGEGGYMPGIHGGPTPDGRPQLADAYDIGRGVHSKGDIGTCEQRRTWLLDWFGRLRDRLRNVRVCCGDWERVCGSPSVTTRLGMTGIFLDPPYAKDCERMQQWAAHLRGEGEEPAAKGKATNRSADLYATDDHDVDHLVARVLNYCRERGADPAMRIALAGYDGEHNELEELGWQPLAWKANGGYANRSAGGNENAGRERIWFSPHCLAEIPEDSIVGQQSLFT